jgi:hypothetical protein
MEAKQTAVMLVLMNALQKKRLDTRSAVDLSMDVYKIVHQINKEQKLKLNDMDAIDLTIHFVTEIAKGKDGILGTSDDLLGPESVQELTDMLRTNFIHDVLKVVTDAVKMNLRWSRTRFYLAKYCCLSGIKK